MTTLCIFEKRGTLEHQKTKRMTKFADKYRIEPNRWQYWDYSASAHYFITICTDGHLCIFGKIQDGQMILSQDGQIIATEIQQIPSYHKRCLLDEWIVMPNHIHLIITLEDYDFDNGVSNIGKTDVEKIHEFSPNTPKTKAEIKTYRKQRRQMLIPKIIGKFKMLTSKAMNQQIEVTDSKN